jgi:predicted ribosomally synthesized peptide with SipW-like signal peptide
MGKGRRSLIVLVLGALMGLMAFGVIGSAAWFTSQDAIEDNVVSAGTLDVQVFGGAFTISNLAPGGAWVGPHVFEIREHGSLNALYDISVGNISQTVSGFKNKVNVRLYTDFSSGSFGDACSGILIYEGPLTGLNGTSSDNAWSNPFLAPNDAWTDPWKVCFQLDSSAGNQFQGASATFDIVVDGYQIDAP